MANSDGSSCQEGSWRRHALAATSMTTVKDSRSVSMPIDGLDLHQGSLQGQRSHRRKPNQAHRQDRRPSAGRVSLVLEDDGKLARSINLKLVSDNLSRDHH